MPISRPSDEMMEAEIEPQRLAPEEGGMATPILAPTETFLLDGFEFGNRWTVEAADGPAAVALSRENTTEGNYSLLARFSPSEHTTFHLRREVRMDLTSMTRLRLDIFADADDAKVSVGFRTTPASRYYESAPIPLKRGWNRDLTFRLDAPQFRGEKDASSAQGHEELDVTSAETGQEEGRHLPGRDDVRRISLIFRKSPTASGAFYIDNIRLDGASSREWLQQEPRIVSVTPSAARLLLYDTFEIKVDFRASFQRYFDPKDIDVYADFLSPEGKLFRAPGFLNEYPDPKEREAVGDWRIRFTPTAEGRWQYTVWVRNSLGEDASRTMEFICGGRGNSRGFVRISRRDPRFFEFDSGEFFYPLGMNVAWATDYKHYFERMKNSGQNFARVWLCPWHLPLEVKREPGVYDLDVARRLDQILALAKEHGIYVQLVIEYHGMLTDASWDANPQNSVNGGPCYHPAEFFTDPEARKLFERKLRYIVARWGHSPHIFAWELFNEADLTGYGTPSDVLKWHSAMVRYLRRIDPHQHLVTTSLSGKTFGMDFWKLAGLDFAQIHLYSLDIARRIGEESAEAATWPRPFFIGEFGASHEPAPDQADSRGVRLHAGLWTSFMTQAAGAAMPWWWDTHVDPNDLYSHWKALAAFAAGEDRRGRNFRQVAVDIGSPGQPLWRAIGLMDDTRALLWFFDPAWISHPKKPAPNPLPKDASVVVTGLIPGEYEVEFWDTYDGTVISRSNLKVTKGWFRLSLAEAPRDFACKVKYLGTRLPPNLLPGDARPEPDDGRAPRQ